ncbi:unnamed protein product [Leptosia nina]|uniref:Cytochrome P450 n=1 Tax=Leptosia nina TaxID=320188 RepID=A0AAV1JMY5_9NEOP
MLFTVVLCITLIFCAVIYFRFNYKARLIAKIPGPTRLPLLGNCLEFVLPVDELFVLSRSLYYKYGPVIGIIAFNLSFVNIYDPEDLEVILSNPKFNDKREPYTFLKPWLCEGLLVSNGLKWHKRRKMLTQAFHFNILKKYARTFTEHAEAFLGMVQAEVGEKTDLMALITSTTLQIMCETTMGTSMNEGIEAVTNKYFNAIHEIGETVVQRLCKVWMFFDWSFNLCKEARDQKRVLDDLHKLTTRIIQERKTYVENNPLETMLDSSEKSNKKGRLAMLDLLLQNEKDGNIDIDGIREEVDTFLFEGHDTTAMAICFMIMQIANDTVVQEKIYDELYNIFGDSKRSPTVDDLAEMKYLECCIKESLRLYPSVPMISRYISEEIQLGKGYRIPKDTMCNIHIYDVHRRSDLFPEPDKFIPERFLPENSINRHPYAYIPFSAGPRNCIGQKFAMLEMKTLVSSLIRRFHVDAITKPSEIRYKCDLVLRATHPIFVRFRNRQ